MTTISPTSSALKDFSGHVPKHGLSGRRHHRLERGKPKSHLGMGGSSKLHSLVQGALRRGANYGQAQLETSHQQKSKLLGQALTLPLSLFLLPV
jgi:hypothetical protein